MSTTYGDISPRTAAFVAARMLERAMPAMCLSRFGQQQPIPKNKTNAIKWRRYNSFAPSTVPLVEGVTPAPDMLTHTDVTATLSQYGRRVQISDAIVDTHEDPVLMESADIMGELAGQTSEVVIYNAIKAGTNVQYVGGSARASVAGPSRVRS
jgi:N4-gp56 family major capsid protein